MNVARTIFRRKGYLLTALAAAVLLAASSGTAWAQSVSFSATTGEVLEGSAAEGATAPRAFRVTVTRSPEPAQGLDNVGDVTLVTNPAGEDGLTAVGVTIMQMDPGPLAGGAVIEIPADGISFSSGNEAVLVFTQADDEDWDNESLTVSLRAKAGTSIGPDLKLTMEDKEAQPIASFNVNPVLLHEGTAEQVVLSIDVPRGASTASRPTEALTALSEPGDALLLSVSPVGAIGLVVKDCAARNSPNVVAYIDSNATMGVARHRDGLSTVLLIGGETGMHAPLADTVPTTVVTPLVLNACPDLKGIKDKSITLTVIGTTNSSRQGLTIRTDAGVLVGTIGTGSPLVINIDSDEAVPTLSFSPTDVTIDEGESTTTRLIAEGKFGAEVGMVKLSVEGDAMVSLMHDGEMLEEMDGHVYVDLGSSNTAALTAMSHSDPDLMDGYEKFKAWKLMEGGTDGANIGDDYWFKVVVMGSTAVPALPLLGQLLLALFLMAGGARLYRRRQG